MRLIFLSALLLFGFAYSAQAACYSMREAEAEQGIRIHSELMVIGLNCQHLGGKGQRNLYLQYKEFTNKNASIFEGYEQTLISHFRSEGARNAERELHTLRTKYANKISKDAATMRPDAFCQVYAPRIQKAGAMSGQDLRKWASTIFPSHPLTRPLCAK
jgi:hypothetical protein